MWRSRVLWLWSEMAWVAARGGHFVACYLQSARIVIGLALLGAFIFRWCMPRILFGMKRWIGLVRIAAAVALLPVMLVQQSVAWGRDGHMMINRLAGAALPSDVPEFLRSKQALDALEYYGPEPDRWKSPAEPELNAAQSPGALYRSGVGGLWLGSCRGGGMTLCGRLAFAQKSHPDLPLTPEKVGLQPYATVEVCQRLKSAMRDYRSLKDSS